MRAKKQREARSVREVMKLRRPAPVKRQNSMPPARTATADPPEKAAEICGQAGTTCVSDFGGHRTLAVCEADVPALYGINVPLIQSNFTRFR